MANCASTRAGLSRHQRYVVGVAEWHDGASGRRLVVISAHRAGGRTPVVAAWCHNAERGASRGLHGGADLRIDALVRAAFGVDQVQPANVLERSSG